MGNLHPAPNPRIAPIVRNLRASLATLYGDRLRGLYLYGSYARGDAREDSDLDISVVLDAVPDVGQELDRMSEVGSRLSLAHDLTITFLPIAEEAFRSMRTPLLLNIRREGVAV